MCDVILSRLIVTPFDRPDCQDVVCFITARKRSLGQGNVFTPVCRSVHGEGSAFRGSLHPGGLHPGGGVCIGGGQIPPRILRDTANEWAVRILQEYILVS